ncbi:MAG: type II toxin-antitoxin system RelE/ParE family toxin, partial [Oscillospiraceae bacterium]|nr:type II toxin-antitoxin system RelE/ParE family toxin [Oscillospiraceae bacterium]
NDLQNIAVYISMDLQSPTAAVNTVEAIETKINKLSTMALSFPIVKDDYFSLPDYRLMPVKNYHVFYIADEKEKTVIIYRILYGRRDWKSLLSIINRE